MGNNIHLKVIQTPGNSASSDILLCYLAWYGAEVIHYQPFSHTHIRTPSQYHDFPLLGTYAFYLHGKEMGT